MFSSEFEKTSGLAGSAFGLASGIAKGVAKGAVGATKGIAKGVAKGAIAAPGVLAKTPGAVVKGSKALAKGTWSQINSPLGLGLTAMGAAGSAGTISHQIQRPMGVTKQQWGEA